MNKLREKIEPAEVKAEKPTKKSGGASVPRALVGVLNGSFLTKEKVLGNMPFILFIAGLMLCYIGYGYWTERTVRDLDRTSSELKEMRSEYLTAHSHLEQAEQQSHVASDISSLGLKEGREAPMRIAVEADQLETRIDHK